MILKIIFTFIIFAGGVLGGFMSREDNDMSMEVGIFFGLMLAGFLDVVLSMIWMS